MAVIDVAELTVLKKKIRGIKETSTLYSDFESELSELPIFNKIVDKLQLDSTNWAVEVGLIKSGPAEEERVSDLETVWKTYFSDHSWRTPEEARNISDLVTILTGVDTGKFILANKKMDKRSVFKDGIVIVPLASTNGHDYTIGQPILSSVMSPIFYKQDGSTGNEMSTRLNEMRLATESEIKQLVSMILFRNNTASEKLLIIGMC